MPHSSSIGKRVIVECDRHLDNYKRPETGATQKSGLQKGDSIVGPRRIFGLLGQRAFYQRATAWAESRPKFPLGARVTSTPHASARTRSKFDPLGEDWLLASPTRRKASKSRKTY